MLDEIAEYSVLTKYDGLAEDIAFFISVSSSCIYTRSFTVTFQTYFERLVHGS